MDQRQDALSVAGREVQVEATIPASAESDLRKSSLERQKAGECFTGVMFDMDLLKEKVLRLESGEPKMNKTTDETKKCPGIPGHLVRNLQTDKTGEKMKEEKREEEFGKGPTGATIATAAILEMGYSRHRLHQESS